MPIPFSECPKCHHSPLPAEQGLPAACPGCGVILAKVGQVPRRAIQPNTLESEELADTEHWTSVLTQVPERFDAFHFWPRVALWVGLAVWAWVLIRLDYRTGEMGGSFLHRPLLVFHEAGHVIFMVLGEWMTVLGGTLGQLLMPLILGGALLLKNRDPFGAAVGLWFLGVSLLDVAPYMYDALHPQLMLLSGTTGEEGGHDWIYLFSSLGLLARSQMIGGLVHSLGAVTVLVALAWGAWLLRREYKSRLEPQAANG